MQHTPVPISNPAAPIAAALLAAVLTLALPARAPAEVTPLDSILEVDLETTVNPNAEPGDVQTDLDSQDGQTNPLHILAEVTDTALTNTSTATTDGWATWTGPAAGRVCFVTHWVAATEETPGENSGGGYRSDHSFSYSFIPDADGTFELAYDLLGSGTSTFGFQYAYDVLFDGNFIDLDLPDANPAQLTGTLSFPVVADAYYIFDIWAFPNLGASYLSNNDVLTAQFEFAIIPTPTACGDPGTSYLTGDVNKDCYVNLLDISVVVNDWLECTDPGGPGCGP